jgi:thiol-disulfide isomerase/thioredoxin
MSACFHRRGLTLLFVCMIAVVVADAFSHIQYGFQLFCCLSYPKTLLQYQNTKRCGHCKSFASSYANVAAAFHSSPKEHIRVGKVDASVERALTARFGVQYFPSFYLISGWSVYPFEDTRSVHNLMDFARGGYKKEEVCQLVREIRRMYEWWCGRLTLLWV